MTFKSYYITGSRRRIHDFRRGIRAVNLIDQLTVAVFVRGELAVDSVFATVRAGIKHVTRPLPGGVGRHNA
jgi:hypothetical protein